MPSQVDAFRTGPQPMAEVEPGPGGVCPEWLGDGTTSLGEASQGVPSLHGAKIRDGATRTGH